METGFRVRSVHPAASSGSSLASACGGRDTLGLAPLPPSAAGGPALLARAPLGLCAYPVLLTLLRGPFLCLAPPRPSRVPPKVHAPHHHAKVHHRVAVFDILPGGRPRRALQQLASAAGSTARGAAGNQAWSHAVAALPARGRVPPFPQPPFKPQQHLDRSQRAIALPQLTMASRHASQLDPC